MENIGGFEQFSVFFDLGKDGNKDRFYAYEGTSRKFILLVLPSDDFETDFYELGHFFEIRTGLEGWEWPNIGKAKVLFVRKDVQDLMKILYCSQDPGPYDLIEKRSYKLFTAWKNARTYYLCSKLEKINQQYKSLGNEMDEIISLIKLTSEAPVGY